MDFINGEAPTDNPPYHMDPEGMLVKLIKKIEEKSGQSGYII